RACEGDMRDGNRLFGGAHRSHTSGCRRIQSLQRIGFQGALGRRFVIFGRNISRYHIARRPLHHVYRHDTGNDTGKGGKKDDLAISLFRMLFGIRLFIIFCHIASLLSNIPQIRHSGHKSMSEQKSSTQMWGGRFASGPDAIMEEINASIGFDRKLYAQDIQGSLAHAAMLAKTGIITAEDHAKIEEGLKTILKEIEDGKFTFSRKLEDIHMNIEARLSELIGTAAGRLHTARSRNDQVAVDMRLWVKQELEKTALSLKNLIEAFLERAEEHTATVMPGFTHLQTAQPVTFGHHCMAYVEMFGRDLSRVRDAIERMDESPLGAAALAGTGFPIDRHMTAQILGFREPTRNSLDSVSDRDYALEFLSIAAICAGHLSRLAEEIVIWSAPQFNFVRLSHAFSTGSSIMPQKKNPDAAEL